MNKIEIFKKALGVLYQYLSQIPFIFLLRLLQDNEMNHDQGFRFFADQREIKDSFLIFVSVVDSSGTLYVQNVVTACLP